VSSTYSTDGVLACCSFDQTHVPLSDAEGAIEQLPAPWNVNWNGGGVLPREVARRFAAAVSERFQAQLEEGICKTRTPWPKLAQLPGTRPGPVVRGGTEGQRISGPPAEALRDLHEGFLPAAGPAARREQWVYGLIAVTHFIRRDVRGDGRCDRPLSVEELFLLGHAFTNAAGGGGNRPLDAAQFDVAQIAEAVERDLASLGLRPPAGTPAVGELLSLIDSWGDPYLIARYMVHKLFGA
jgi:hypothetical protein